MTRALGAAARGGCWDVSLRRARRAAGGGGGLRNCASRSRVTFTVSASVIIFQFSHAEVRALGSRKLNILL